MPERRVGLPAGTAPCLVTSPGRGRGVTDHRQQLPGQSWSSQHIYSFLLSLQFTACGDPGGAPASGGTQGRELDQCSAPWGRSRLLGTLCLLMGVIFELPLLCWLLAKMGVLKAAFIRLGHQQSRFPWLAGHFTFKASHICEHGLSAAQVSSLELFQSHASKCVPTSLWMHFL